MHLTQLATKEAAITARLIRPYQMVGSEVARISGSQVTRRSL
jgi:hypothetical protein